MEDSAELVGVIRLLIIFGGGFLFWWLYDRAIAPLWHRLQSSALWVEYRLPLALAVIVGLATYFGDPTAPEQSDMAVGASVGAFFLALLIRRAGRRYLFGREFGERRTRLRQGAVVLA